MSSTSASPASPAAALRQMAMAYTTPQVLYAAAKLGIADLLAAGPRTGGDLAAATGAHPQALRRLLRALGSIGVLARVTGGADGGGDRGDMDGTDDRWELTALGGPLREEAADSQWAWILTMVELSYRVWGELVHSVRTGEPAFERAFGESFYEYVASHPDAARTWDRMMDESAREWLAPVAANLDFTGVDTLVDVGGGHGTVLAAALKANPAMRGVLFDLPHVVAGAGKVLQKAGVAERCQVVGGDMFESVPEGGDAYCLARVLFNWDDERALTILKNCRRAMAPAGRVVVIGVVLPEGDVPAGMAINDLGLLAAIGGRERTEAELRALCSAADLTVVSVARVPPQAGHSRVLIAVRTERR